MARSIAPIATMSLGLILLLAAAPATGQQVRSLESTEEESSQGTGERNSVGSFDGWIVSFDRGRPHSAHMCGTVGPRAGFSVAGCGSGAGFMYPQRPGQTDLAHFRAQYGVSVPVAGTPGLTITPGIGLTELSRSRDRGGLQFAPGRGPEVREASGAEVSVGVELLSTDGAGPVRSFKVKWVSGVAWVPDAPAVVPVRGPVLPFSNLTLNGSF